jgi:hypothetical protein
MFNIFIAILCLLFLPIYISILTQPSSISASRRSFQRSFLACFITRQALTPKQSGADVSIPMSSFPIADEHLLGVASRIPGAEGQLEDPENPAPPTLAVHCA